ncbi:hypothetical protein P8452_61836 [Trifolium repens]|nr:hypothetical protein P8452_61836 [Trifolium repens]
MASYDQQPRKRLIIKLSYASKKDDVSCTMDDDSQGNKKRRLVKPIVSCYWLDANQPLQKKDNKNIENQHTKEGFVIPAKDHSMKNDGNGTLQKDAMMENKSKVKKKAIGLKDIEGKLKSYSSPDEFADDMRFVFDHGLCYPRGDDVYRIAARPSYTFEHKWKVLKKEWELEEKRLKYKTHKRKMESQSLCPKIR